MDSTANPEYTAKWNVKSIRQSSWVLGVEVAVSRRFRSWTTLCVHQHGGGKHRWLHSANGHKRRTARGFSVLALNTLRCCGALTCGKRTGADGAACKY